MKKLLQLATSAVLIGASLGIVIGLSCSKHHDPILPPPDPDPVECPEPEPCDPCPDPVPSEITSTLIAEVVQDHSPGNVYRVFLNGTAIIDTVFNEPADNKVVELSADYVFVQGSEFEFFKDGSNSRFVRVRL